MQGLIRSRFFRRLLAAYAAVVVVTALVTAVLVDRQLSRSLTEGLTETLRDQCTLLSPFSQRVLESGAAGGDAQAELERIGAATGLRLTLVAADGRVLADSGEQPAGMENHGKRPEIAAARTAEFGSSRRLSRTVGYELVYVAHRLERGGDELGFVRVALPLSELNTQLAAARASVLFGAGIGLALALVLAAVLANRTTAPIVEMTRVAEGLRAGRYEKRTAVRTGDEIGVLGDTLNLLGVEITERISRLSEEDAQLRAMFAGMVEGVIAVDEEDRLRFCNEAARRMLALPQGDLEGQRLVELVRIVGLQELLAGESVGAPTARTEFALGLDPRRRVLAAHASGFVGGGRSGKVVVLHDITEIRRLEQIRRDFVANVSHELKTPLTSIKGFVETLLDGALHDDEKNEQFLRRIDVNVGRLHHLVSDLLSLARIESQGGAVELQPVDWRIVLRDVLQRRRHALEKKGLVLRTGADPLVVQGDLEAMTQVLENLLDNAIQYTPAPGSIEVRLERAGRVGALSVVDTGVGIPPEETERVFERFYRVDKARSRDLGGTGLGLSIVKHLVLAMQGRVTLESRVGQGSTFRVELLLAAEHGAARPAAE